MGKPLETGFNFPINITLFSKGGLFYGSHKERVTAAKIKSLEDTSKDLSEATTTLKAISDIASRYGLIISGIPSGYCYDGFLLRKTSLSERLYLSKNLENESSVNEFGQAIAEFVELEKQEPYKSRVYGGKGSSYERGLESYQEYLERARQGIEKIKRAKPLFKEHREVIEKYLKEEAPFF